MHRIAVLVSTLIASFLIGGCTASRYDGKRPPDPSKAIIVGSIAEGYLAQPHGLRVDIVTKSEPATHIRLETLNGNPDEWPSRSLRGNFFMYEVPPGEYEVTSWNYQFYAGHALPRKTPVRFTIKAGETAYIGDFYANALVFCLSNVDMHERTLEKLRQKYPMLVDRTVLNLTPQSAFQGWPSSDAKDYGNGLCKM